MLSRATRTMLRQPRMSMVVRSASALPSTPTPDFPGEYPEPHLLTEAIPGPKSQELAARLSQTQDTGTLQFFVDYEASRGNYMVDADGNRILDVFGQIASLPIGYNHPTMLSALSDPKNIALLAHRPALGMLPPTDWVERLEASLQSVAPTGLPYVATMSCGSCSNENAYKAAFMWYRAKERGGPPTQEDLESCMTNQAPGSPNLSVLSFSGGFHGRLLGCLSTTHSKAIHKVDVPAFDWPTAPFPKLKYPLDEHVEANRAEEERCVEAARAAIRAYADKAPVAAVIIEPIQAEGGDNGASPEFFRAIQQVAAEAGAAFIVDEVQTGLGATGFFWAHEAWDLPTSPDIVTFSKKFQTGGYFHKPEFRPEQAYRIFNTWMGEPSKIIQLEAILDVVRAEGLVENTRTTGAFVEEGLRSLGLKNVRGSGTFLAFDCDSTAERDALVGRLRNRGVQAGGCGVQSVRFRPALVFQPKHAEIFLDRLEQSLA